MLRSDGKYKGRKHGMIKRINGGYCFTWINSRLCEVVVLNEQFNWNGESKYMKIWNKSVPDQENTHIKVPTGEHVWCIWEQQD